MSDLDARYGAAVHRQQSAMAFDLQKKLQREPGGAALVAYCKHLRVGVNNAMADHSALVMLLLEKGLLTDLEYREAITVAAEREADRCVEHVRREYGLPDGVEFG